MTATRLAAFDRVFTNLTDRLEELQGATRELQESVEHQLGKQFEMAAIDLRQMQIALGSAELKLEQARRHAAL